MEAGGKATGLSPWQLGHAQVTRAWPIRRARVRSGLWTREAGLGLSRKAAVLLSGGSGRTSWWQGQGMRKDAGFPTCGLPGGLSHAWPPRRPSVCPHRALHHALSQTENQTRPLLLAAGNPDPQKVELSLMPRSSSS